MGTPIHALDLSVTLSEALEELTARYQVAGLSPQTIAMFDTHIGHLIEFLSKDGITTLDQVTTAHVTAFLAREQKRGLKPASVHVILRTLRRYFAVALDAGHITVNPAKAVIAPRVVMERVRFLDDAQVETLLASIGRSTLEDVRDAALLRVLASGMRRGEAMGLRVEDVDLDARTALIRASTSKTRQGRTVGLSRDAVVHLKTYLRVREAYLRRNHRQREDALWIAAKGPLSANGALQMVYRRLEAARLPKVSLHSFRHGWAAKVVQRGMPTPYILQQGGWVDATMINTRYGHFAIEENALSAMRDFLDA